MSKFLAAMSSARRAIDDGRPSVEVHHALDRVCDAHTDTRYALCFLLEAVERGSTDALHRALATARVELGREEP